MSLRVASSEELLVAERLWQLYSHDLSEFRGTMPDTEGRFTAGRFPTYFDDPDRVPYFIVDGDVLAGFAFIRGLAREPRAIGDFFVVRAARKRGVGHAAALELLRRHPGRWEIAFQEENPKAARFWRRVATDIAGAGWSEERRPVPGKPQIPPDTWLMLTV